MVAVQATDRSRTANGSFDDSEAACFWLQEDIDTEWQTWYWGDAARLPGVGNVKCFDMPSGMESLKQEGVSKVDNIILCCEATDGRAPPLVPLDPGDYGCRTVSTQNLRGFAPEAVEFAADGFPLVFDSGCPNLEQATLVGVSGIPQKQMDNLVSLPSLTVMEYWDRSESTPNLHIKAPSNAKNMKVWGFSLSDTVRGNTAEDWERPNGLENLLLEGFDSIPDRLAMPDGHTDSLRHLALRNCGLDTSAALRLLEANTRVRTIDVSGNPDIDTLPYISGEQFARCYHTDVGVFGKQCECPSSVRADEGDWSYQLDIFHREEGHPATMWRWRDDMWLDHTGPYRLLARRIGDLQRGSYPFLNGRSFSAVAQQIPDSAYCTLSFV